VAVNSQSVSRRLLQVLTGLASAQALAGGGLYLARGVAGLSAFTPSPLPIDPTDPSWGAVDYMFRALAGIWFTIGLMLAFVVRSIERQTTWFFFLQFAVFAMGIGRALSAASVPLAPGSSEGAMITELALPPIMVLWQRSVARAFAARAD
jgi:hypothetical protein